jgi:hypothetical protein
MLPNFFDLISDTFLIGLKGQKDVLKYLTRKGYASDKYGIPWNLWAVRIHEHCSGPSYGKMLFLSCSTISSNFHFLCVGDSMIKFLLLDKNFRNVMVHVYSEGGGLISDVHSNLQRLSEMYPPKVIFVHAGVNNLSKCYLYVNEFHQLSVAQQEFKSLTLLLQTLCTQFPQVHVILSSIITTKDDFINARSEIINEMLKQTCKENRWSFMNNANLNRSCLRDNVHLNRDGEHDIVLSNN